MGCLAKGLICWKLSIGRGGRRRTEVWKEQEERGTRSYELSKTLLSGMAKLE